MAESAPRSISAGARRTVRQLNSAKASDGVEIHTRPRVAGRDLGLRAVWRLAESKFDIVSFVDPQTVLCMV